MEERINRLLKLTETLQAHVLDKQDDPDEWNEILDQRQQIIEELQVYIELGNTFSENHKQVISSVMRIDQEIGPIMEKAKKDIEEQLKLLERTKLAKRQYDGSERYGRYDDYSNSHFFDQKK